MCNGDKIGLGVHMMWLESRVGISDVEKIVSDFKKCGVDQPKCVFSIQHRSIQEMANGVPNSLNLP